MIRSRKRAGTVPYRWLLEVTVLGTVVALMVRTWLFMGLVIPLEVTGPSMADVLRGRHFRMSCSACKFDYAWGGDRATPPQQSTCPNCGYTENDSSALPLVAGDRVLVDRSAFVLRNPRRWEPVVLRHPEHASELAVKRVVGLPGEALSLRHGDVYVDGRVQRKNLAQQLRVAVPVHDSRWHDPTRRPGERFWQPQRTASGWQPRDDGFECAADSEATGNLPGEPNAGLLTDGAEPADSGVDWLVFSSQRRLRGDTGEAFPVPITNLHAYNQTRRQRAESIRPVRDVMVTVDIESIDGMGNFYIAATDGAEEFCARFDPADRRVTCYRDGAVLDCSVPLPSTLAGARLICSLFDRQFLLAANGAVICLIPLNGGVEPAPAYLTPVAIGSERLRLQIARLQVHRDVYYSVPRGDDGRMLPSHWQLASGECFVLGDNSEFSEDSRHWHEDQPAAVNLLIGKPLAVHWPSRQVDWAGRRFQVPDPGRMRYIR